MTRGATATIDLYIERPPGTPLPVSNALFWLSAKVNQADLDVAAKIRKLPADPGFVTFPDPAPGHVRLTIAASDTDSATTFPDPGLLLYHDIKIKTADGQVEYLEEGTLYVKGNITRASS
jgi:hypothetical protein